MLPLIPCPNHVIVLDRAVNATGLWDQTALFASPLGSSPLLDGYDEPEILNS
jgi:hypothetical protein